MKRIMKLGVVLLIMALFVGMFTVSAEHSESTEVTASVFSLPDDTIEGKMDVVVKGNTYTQSTKGIEIKSIGKNILPNLECDYDNVINNGDGSYTIKTVENDYGYYSPTKIKVQGGKTYTLSCKKINTDIDGRISIIRYDKSGNRLGNICGDDFSIRTGSITKSIEDSTEYISIRFVSDGSTASGYESKIYDIQLEEGSTATSYAKYENSTVYIDKTLRSASDISDNINLNSGVFIQNVREDNTLIKNTTGWGYTDDGLTNTMRFGKSLSSIGINDLKIPTINTSKAKIFFKIGEKIFPVQYDSILTNTDEEMVVITVAGSFGVRVNKTTASTPAEFEDYLQANPVTLNYQLATPITTQLTPQNLIAYPNGTIVVETEEDSTLPTIEYSVPIDTGGTVDNLVEQVTGIFDIINNHSKRLDKLEKNTPSIAPIYINCIQDKEINVALTVANIRDVDQRTFTVTYSTDDFILQDLCTSTETMEKSTITSTYPIDETDIVILENTIDDTVGTVKFRVNKYVSYGNSWSGVVNTMAFKANESGQKSITFEVE